MRETCNQPHGGVLIQRISNRATHKLDGLPTLQISEVSESEAMNIASGAFSPLEGFMGAADFASVCGKNTLSSGLVWTLPVVLDISEEQKNALDGASKIILESQKTGEKIGFLEPSEIFPHDRATHTKAAFGVDSDLHPGVRRVRAMGAYLIAGKITIFSEALQLGQLLYPSEIRERLNFMRLHTVAGFQTRNIVHRAHEYLQRVALEICDGLLVHPVIGWKKSGDFQPEVLRHAYTKFIDAYYPKERVVLAFLKLAMRYAGPKEAVFHAIVRKNYGCSHFIVGRDHAGVQNFYDTYAAHKIFETLPDLGIQILKLREPFFCRRCESIASDKTCGHAEADREYISGTKIRAILSGGTDPSNHIFRREVLESLRAFSKEEIFYA